MESQLIHYSGEKNLSDIQMLDDIVVGNDENEGLTKKINEMYRYVLRLYDRLINGQKTLVTLIEVQIFFDILVSDRETPDECEE
ncbi:18655_t:CDS:2, partial [Funneliformis geosporum]